MNKDQSEAKSMEIMRIMEALGVEYLRLTGDSIVRDLMKSGIPSDTAQGEELRKRLGQHISELNTCTTTERLRDLMIMKAIMQCACSLFRFYDHEVILTEMKLKLEILSMNLNKLYGIKWNIT